MQLATSCSRLQLCPSRSRMLLPTLPRRVLSRRLNIAVAELHATAAWEEVRPAGAGMADAPLQPPTPPPEVVPYSGGSNYVKLVGTVLRDATTRHIARLNQPVATCPVGLRPTYSPATGPQPGMGSITVEAYGFQALQLAQHVRQGMQIAVEGHLKQDRWRDQATGQPRSLHKVVVERLRLVDGSHAAMHEHEEQQDAEEAAAIASHEALQHVPGAQQPPQQQQQPPPQQQQQGEAHVRAAQHPTASSSASHQMWQEQGLSFHQVAQQRAIKQGTVLNHIFIEAAAGKPLDWERAASELQVGPPGSPWLTLPEVASAIQAVQAEMPDTPLLQLPLARIREELERGIVTGAKLGALEHASPDRTLTYGVIRLGLAVAARGLDPAALVSHAPAPLQPTLEQPPF